MMTKDELIIMLNESAEFNGTLCEEIPMCINGICEKMNDCDMWDVLNIPL